jgi:hypothetical protein
MRTRLRHVGRRLAGRGQRFPSNDRERAARRLPAFILVALLVIAGITIKDRGTDPAVSAPSATRAVDLAPVGPSPDARSATWYCAGGTAQPGGPADHLVVVTNTADEEATGTIQAFPNGAQPLPPRPITVPARSQLSIRVGDLVNVDYAAAMVETRGGTVIVEHEVRGPSGGHDQARCASRASATWYLPWGMTTTGQTLRLALLNPFPGDAVIDITFDTEDGYRSPENFQSLLVPAHRLVVLNIEDVVTRRQRVSTRIVARSGRLVVDQLQTVGGSEGGQAIDLTPGAPSPAVGWYFADGRVDPGTVERFVVFNPGDRPAVASVTILTGTGSAAQGLPFQLRIPAGTSTELTLNGEPRVPKPLAHATLIQAEGDQLIVAERLLITGQYIPAAPSTAPANRSSATTTTTAPATPGTPGTPNAAAPTTTAPAAPPQPPLPPLPAGLAGSLGEPLVASTWVVGLPAAPPGTAAGSTLVSVFNPVGPGKIEVKVSVLAASGTKMLRQEAISPGHRVDVAVPTASGSALSVEASGRVVVSRIGSLSEPAGLSSEPAMPVSSAATVPDRVHTAGADDTG